jgi:4'-phosphopantetheinyl transferase EntD
VIEEILSTDVAAAEARDDPPDATLFAEEEAPLTRAVHKRRREFTTARLCARRALAELGLPPRPLLPGPTGEPQWPAGIVGSITHCDGYRAAAVARTAAVRTIGIDAETHGALPGTVVNTISLPEERAWVRELSRSDPGVWWDRLLFSAKESVYKAWFPLARRWLGFEQAAITVDPDGTFSARLLVAGLRVDDRELCGFTGRWLVRDGLVLTAIALAAPAQQSPAVVAGRRSR